MGDGLIGEDITNNEPTIKTLPIKINYEKPIEIRGEIFFKKILKKLMRKFLMMIKISKLLKCQFW